MAILTWGASAALALAVGVMVYLLVSAGGELATRWWQQRRRNSPVSFITETTRTDTDIPFDESWRPSRKLQALIGVEIPVALYIGVNGGLLISIGILISGAATVAYSRKRAAMEQHAHLTDQVEELLSEYYSRWLLNASPFGVLEDIAENVTFGVPLDNILQQALSRYRLGEPDALAPLRGTDPYLQQFGYILAQTARAGNRVTADAINEVLKRLRVRHRLQKRVGTVTAMVRSEEMFLLFANATVISTAIALPLLQEFYTGSIVRQLILAIAVVMVTAGGIYFDYEIESLKEKAL